MTIYSFSKSDFIESGIFQDYIGHTQTITFSINEESKQDVLETSFINPSADIIKWQYKIY